MSAYEQLFKTVFWVSFLIIIYTYLGYAILTILLVQVRKLLTKPKEYPTGKLPSIAFIVAAYNEEQCIRQKIKNTIELSYPRELLQIILVTDGSTDATPRIAGEFAEVRLLHLPDRQGKAAALNRAVAQTDAEILVFSDANAILNPDSLRKIARHYSDPKVGGVAGEKRIFSDGSDVAQGKGEGTYWKYESMLKALDSELYSIVGAAGELFSIRRSLYEPLPLNTILDDFVISLQVCVLGYKVKYEPAAFASELASISVRDEMKRKVRISAGGMQAMGRLVSLLKFWQHPLLSYLYVSHRVLRWTLAPVALICLLFSNIGLVLMDGPEFFGVFLLLQSICYLLAGIGWWFASRDIRVPGLYVPFYFLFMNVSVVAGFFVFIRNRHTVLWEKSERFPSTPS